RHRAYLGSLAGAQRRRNSSQATLRFLEGTLMSSAFPGICEEGNRRGFIMRSFCAAITMAKNQEKGRDQRYQSRQRRVYAPSLCGKVHFGKVVAAVEFDLQGLVDRLITGRGITRSRGRGDLFQNVRRGRGQRWSQIIHAADPAATLPQIVRIVLVLNRVVVDSGKYRKFEQRPPLRDIRAQMKDMRSRRDSASSHLAVENLDEVHVG